MAEDFFKKTAFGDEGKIGLFALLGGIGVVGAIVIGNTIIRESMKSPKAIEAKSMFYKLKAAWNALEAPLSRIKFIKEHRQHIDQFFDIVDTMYEAEEGKLDFTGKNRRRV